MYPFCHLPRNTKRLTLIPSSPFGGFRITMSTSCHGLPKRLSLDSTMMPTSTFPVRTIMVWMGRKDWSHFTVQLGPNVWYFNLSFLCSLDLLARSSHCIRGSSAISFFKSPFIPSIRLCGLDPNTVHLFTPCISTTHQGPSWIYHCQRDRRRVIAGVLLS